MGWLNLWFDPDKYHHSRDGFRNTEPYIRRKDDLKRWRKAKGLPTPLLMVIRILFSSDGSMPICPGRAIRFGG